MKKLSVTLLVGALLTLTGCSKPVCDAGWVIDEVSDQYYEQTNGEIIEVELLSEREDRSVCKVKIENAYGRVVRGKLKVTPNEDGGYTWRIK